MDLDPYLNTHCWFDYPQFYEWIASLPDMKIVAEIGSWKGHSTSFLGKKMMENKKDFRIYAVDVWEKWEQYTVFDETQTVLLESVRRSYDIFNKNLEMANIRQYVTDIREDSHHGHLHFEDGFFDLVFLDADHSYKVVKKDIELWYPKIRKGGIIGGHDYLEASCGVKKAVDERFRKVSTMGSAWYYFKE